MQKNKLVYPLSNGKLLIWTLLIGYVFMTGFSKAKSREFYQIKIYSIENEQQEQRMDKFLEDAYLPALHRAGISKVGVFKPNEDHELWGKAIFVWIPFRSLKQFEKLPAKLNNDQQYQQDGRDYIDAKHDNAPYKRIESILLKAFKDMPRHGIPKHDTPPAERVYELRSYEGPTEKLYRKKVEMFNEGGEVILFNSLEFHALFYGEVISGPTMPNLMYMTTFANKASQSEHWDAFRNHPDWLVLKEIEAYKNTVSKNVKYMLHPTDYSDL